jgi:hypothetical protein
MFVLSKEKRATLVEALGLEILPKVIQDEHIENFEKSVLMSGTSELMKRIPDDRQEEFRTLSSEGDGEQIDRFIEEFLPEGSKNFFENIVEREIEIRRVMKEQRA